MALQMGGRVRTSRLALALVVVLAGSRPLAADWNVTQFRDDRTGDSYNLASLAASDGGAWLRMKCVNRRMFPNLAFAKPITAPNIVRVRATYKFDSGAPMSRMAPVVDKGREVWLWVGEPESTVQRIARGRTLLVEMFPAAEETVAFQFNLTGADRIVPQVRCPPLAEPQH
jgi:hypothetical protein